MQQKQRQAEQVDPRKAGEGGWEPKDVYMIYGSGHGDTDRLTYLVSVVR